MTQKPLSKEEQARRDKVTNEHNYKTLKKMVANIFQITSWDDELNEHDRENMQAINFGN